MWTFATIDDERPRLWVVVVAVAVLVGFGIRKGRTTDRRDATFVRVSVLRHKRDRDSAATASC